MSSQDKAKKDVKGKGREVPLEEPVSGQSAEGHTDEQGFDNGLLRFFQGVSNLPTRPSREVSIGTIQWLRSIPIPPVALNDPSHNRGLYRAITEPGAGNSGTLRPEIVDAGEGIFRTVLLPRILASSNTPQPWEEHNHRSRSNSAADANGRQMKMGLRPHSKSAPILRRAILPNSNTNQSSSSSEDGGGPINNDYVLRLLCPGLPNEFQTHALFGYDADGAADGRETGLPDFLRGVGQASAARGHEQGHNDSRNTPALSNREAATGTVSSSEATSRSLGQDRNRAQPHQRSPLSMVDTIEHAPLIDPPLISHTARNFRSQVQSTPPMALGYHPPAAQARQDISPIELSMVSDVAGDMPSINQVLQQSISQLPIEGYIGIGSSYPAGTQRSQLHPYEPLQLLLTSRNGEFITSAIVSQENFISPTPEISYNEGRQHSSHASTLVGTEPTQSRWRRIWHGLRHRHRGCLCSLPAREVSEGNSDAHETNIHTTESDYQTSAPTHHAYIFGWRDRQGNAPPPPRNSQNGETNVTQEPGNSRNESIYAHQENDAASNAPTLVPPKGFIRRLKDSMKAIVEKLIAHRAANNERCRIERARLAGYLRTREAEAAIRAELAQFSGISEVEASNIEGLMDKDR